MLLDQKILIEFKGEQAHEFLTLFRDLKQLVGQNGIQFSHNKKYLNIEEAAEYIDRPKSYLYSQTHQNLIPNIKKGRKLYFLKEDLDTFLLSGKREVSKLRA